MFGLSGLALGVVRASAGAWAVLGGELEPPPVSTAAAAIAAPAPASSPPATRPCLIAVRLSTLLSCSGSMLSMRALILGAGAALGLALVGVSAAAAQTGPACAPATLNNSALQDGVVTVSPLAGSRDATPQTQISFLGVPAGDLSAISVVGSRTGAHSGRLAPYSQGDGASFLPSQPVRRRRARDGARARAHRRLRASAARRVPGRAARIRSARRPGAPSRAAPRRCRAFTRARICSPPVVTVTAQSPAVAGGDVFVAPYGGTGPGGADDPRTERRAAVVQAAARQHRGDQPARFRNTRANRC